MRRLPIFTLPAGGESSQRADRPYTCMNEALMRAGVKITKGLQHTYSHVQSRLVYEDLVDASRLVSVHLAPHW